MADLKIQSLERAISILDLFTLDNSELTINEIIEKTQLSRSTAYRFVYDLERANLLSFNLKTKKYRLGFKLVEYGMTALNTIDLRKIAYPHLDQLRKNTNENVNMGFIDNTEVVFLERLESERLFRMKFQIGSRVPIHCAAIGKLMLGYLPKDEQDGVINKIKFTKLTSNTILNATSLREELEKIKKQGYAISNREFIEEVKTIAVPIFDHLNKVVAACNVTGPYYRFTEEVIQEKILPHLYFAGESISRELGYKGEYNITRSYV